MILEDAFLECANEQLSTLVSNYKHQTPQIVFHWDSYIAMSLMQKAIRRNDVTNTLSGVCFISETMSAASGSVFVSA